MSEEDIVLEAFTEFLNAVEAGIAAARQLIKATKVGWDPDKVKWEQTQGSKGSYERSDDVNNPEYKGMVKDLAAHGGRVTQEGYFYWTFEDGATVGRKKRGKREVKPAEAGEETSTLFPEDLRAMLSYEETPEWIVIRPRQFLGSENFSKIAAIVKDNGGQYISAGKESHFRLPKQAGK